MNGHSSSDSHLIEITSKIEALESITRLALDAAKIGVWCWYPSDNTIFWDSGMFELFDTTPEQFSSDLHGFESRVHPQDLPVVRDRLVKCMTGEIPYDCNYRVKDKQGVWKVIKGHGDMTIDNHGKNVMGGICIQLNNLAEPSRLASTEELLKPVVG